MNNKPKTKLLTISLLCCGRPDTTERCLKSLMPIRQAIDSELQVVDTGCSKETRAVIEKYADEIFEFKWVNDFAAARNFQLDQANGKMFLFIDDDEWFLDTKYIIEFFKEKECVTYNIGGYFQRNYLDFDGKEYDDVEVIRMCSVTPETRFVGKVHEYIEPAYGNAMFMDARAGHFGYVYANEEDNIKHSMRNIPLLQDMMKEDPDNFRWPYQLAQELRATKNYEELYKLCKENYEKASKLEDNESVRYRGSFICGVVYALRHMANKEDEVIAIYEEQKKNQTIMDPALYSLAFMASCEYFSMHENEKCKDACNSYLKFYEKYHEDKAKFILEGGLFINNAYDDTSVSMVYCFLMTIGMDEDDYGPLVHYYRKIGWNSGVVRLNRGFMMMLLQKSAEIGYKKELRDVLNKFFVNKGFRDLIEHEIEEIYTGLTVEQLDNMKAAFRETDGQKEMELFLHIRTMEKRISSVEYWENYKQLRDILEAYAQVTVKWQRAHDNLFPSETATFALAPETKLGCAITDFLEVAETDSTKALKIIKDMFGHRSIMTDTIQALGNLYSDYVKVRVAKETDPAKFQEMYNLEEQVLRQIADLDAAGHTDEAVATYQQLVRIISDTYGVESLHV
ncbi:Glycosyl transferase family 2 [Pseudobutyrivibrio sp. YE44]|uniref:glycosyltransferase n=1 Tax=Pseudobutyrivibrio sp. YE44 TaxID=1520802 RepID=UPI0008850F55|nr:glycosyltransferase [Pseudobutyrivibrio sp. YE44]SDB38117.1 Glycosyl transferase family 2 [Pseudobutyrivibrio sp. YE44]